MERGAAVSLVDVTPVREHAPATTRDTAVLLVDRHGRITHSAGWTGDASGVDQLVGGPLAALLSSRSARLTARALRAAFDDHETSTVRVRRRPPADNEAELLITPLAGNGDQVTRATVVIRESGGPPAAPPDGADGADAIGRLAATISHELTEPLLIIRGYADALRQDAAERLMADELRQLDVIGRTASRMQTLIDALLHHAEVGRAQVGLELVDMNHVVDEALAMLAVQVASSGAVVRRGRIVEVRGDARLLTVLVRNLLSNALRFARTPVPIVKVSCVPVPGGWRLEVADNGVGIPEHEHERIFEMFERVDRSRHGGFGVGLATVKRIAQLHGGRVEVESEVGRGSRFRVSLTTRREPADGSY